MADRKKLFVPISTESLGLRTISDIDNGLLFHIAERVIGIIDAEIRAPVKAFEISSGKRTSIIQEFDLCKATQSTLLKDYSILHAFLHNDEGNPIAVVKSIRPLIEGWCRVHFINRFDENEWLGDFIDKIRMCDESDCLSHIKPDLADIEELNDYSKRYHHSDCDNHPIPDINPDDLKGYIRRTLNLICASYNQDDNYQ